MRGSKLLWGHPSMLVSVERKEDMQSLCDGFSLRGVIHPNGKAVLRSSHSHTASTSFKERPEFKGHSPKPSSGSEVRQPQVRKKGLALHQTSVCYPATADGHRAMQDADRRAVATGLLSTVLLLIAVGMHKTSNP